MRAAFSLVELSIVLVILGLLTGGILTGQSLIRAAELRSITTEFQTLQTSVFTFQDKYFAIPGDMANATDFWTAMTNCGAASPSGSGTQTCSGDGDGQIENDGAASQTGELMSFWQHLANAGLVEGSFTGIAGSGGGTHSIIGENVPASKLSGAGWSVHYQGVTTGASDVYDMDYGHLVRFGGQTTSNLTQGLILTPEEAWNIDKKVDDGKPAYGKVVAKGWDDTCASADDGTSSSDDREASYRLSDSSIQCTVFFPRAF